jgi:ribose transport system permease protein
MNTENHGLIKTKNKRDLDVRGIVLFSVLLIMIIIFSFISKYFFTLNNFMNLGMYSAVNGIIALGMTFIIITGNMDLSVGAIMSWSGIITAYMLSLTGNVFLSVILALLVGIVVGIVNGILVTRLKVNSIIITIGTMLILRGAVYLLTFGRMISFGKLTTFEYFGPKRLFGIIPMAFIIMIFVYIIGIIVLSRLRFGRHVYAIGGNIRSAKLAGIKINLMIITVFAIGGLASALSGVIMTSLVGSGMPQVGFGKEIDIIAAVILGGAAVNGGKGNLFGTFIGIWIMEVIGNGLTQLNLITFYQDIFRGVILIAAIYFDQLREIRSQN